ncbi:hypothetical protein JAAARDRAFT_148681 [Jaapia argillacea MUCL 33604]|uniref:Cytochrome P450 n=1 Tax=Jaapia argillacea MUCL 33604 TaxID=933084 RepID=A0A067QEX0_9AGAM|nr:hypothetical protein JAAARDRAFT_148681 [Jaapia argillacea MUCL 33604]
MAGSITPLDIALGGLAVLLLKRLLTSPKNLPPGPKGLPLIGNALDMPKERTWTTFTKWAEIWGDVVYVNVLGQPIVLLNSPKHANELLDKRSLIYSDRPKLIMAGELAGNKYTTGLLPYGSRLRQTRMFYHRFMGTKSSIEKFFPVEEQETHRFLLRLLDEPENLVPFIRQTIGSIILQITYDYRVKGHDDLIVQVVDRSLKQFSTLTAPGAFLVDVIPILRFVPSWFPGAGFKRFAAECAKTESDMVHLPAEYVKKQMVAGRAGPSFISNILQEKEWTPEEVDIIEWAAAAMYGGGYDTTYSSIHTFFLAMMLFPDVQKKAQAEIDAVIGSDRLPSFEDRESLPYMESLLKEVFRWQPVAPLGLPHVATEDDVYEGYTIPKGSLVLANLWKFLHDPKTYVNPMEFNPDRYLGKQPEQDPRLYCFGYGRRICPGINLANASVFITCAMTLAVFNITKPVDRSGCVIEPSLEFSSGTISHPPDFQCSITPRTAKAERLIRSVEVR